MFLNNVCDPELYTMSVFRLCAFPNTLLVQTLEWTVPYDLYKDQLVDHTALMLTVLGRVSETQQILGTRFNFHLRTPNIILTVSPQVALILSFLLTKY